MSAVSRKVQPASRAAWTVAIDSVSSEVTPYDWDMPMQPRPRRETVRSPSWDSRMVRTYPRRGAAPNKLTRQRLCDILPPHPSPDGAFRIFTAKGVGDVPAQSLALP